MGDYSSTFSIHNNLAVDLAVIENGEPVHGYWLRWPNSGKVGLLSTSDQFQLKDYLGLQGTEARILIKGKRPDTGKEFTILLHMACPTDLLKTNFVELWVENDEPNLLIGAGPVKYYGHPFIYDVTIDWSK